MKLNFAIILIALTLLLSCNTEARKSGSSSRRTSSSSSSRGTWARNPTSRPSQQQSSSGSNPGSIGWNIPSKQSTSINNKQPALNSGTITKSTATNVQSSGSVYQPSGGYGHNTGGAFGQQGVQRTPSAPYPPGGNTHNNPSISHNNGYGTPGGHPPSYGTAMGHPPSYGTAMGQPPSYQSIGQSYHPPQYNSHNPNGYQQQPHGSYQANSYNPSYGHSYTPGAGYNPPVGGFSQPQTIFVQSGQSSRPGIGQLAKEAFVFAGVSAGVNAVVNRVLPGGIHNIPSHSYGGSAPVATNGVVPGATHTEITYNNYYNNGTPGVTSVVANDNGNNQAGQVNSNIPVQNSPNSNIPVQNVPNLNPPPLSSEIATQSVASPPPPPPPPAAAAAPPPPPIEEELKFTSPMGRDTFKREIEQLSEELLANDNNDALQYITVSLQGQKTDGSTTDDAQHNLLTVNPAAWEIPTIKAVLALHDNYELDAKKKENITEQKRDEENTLINIIFNTDVMKRMKNFLIEKGYISDDDYEFKNALKRIWFTQFKRTADGAGSSGFETVFLAEKLDSEIIGLHNWIYYAKKEEDKELNYLGYIKHTPIGHQRSMVKVRSNLNNTPQDVTTLFIGTSPELEFALYTMCFYISPNYPCPIKLSGQHFIISISRVIYFDKDILVSAFPDLWIPPPSPPAQSSVIDKSNIDNNQQIISSHSLSSNSNSAGEKLIIAKINLFVLLMIIKLF